LGFKLNVMALTPSTMPALGTQAPSFSLPDIISGKTVSLDAVMGDKGVLVMFICGHCPFVVHVQSQLAQLGKDYQDSGLGIAAICSNDEGVSPRDSLANLKAQAEQQGFVFPYLKDDSQDVAKAYDAACTPSAIANTQARNTFAYSAACAPRGCRVPCWGAWFGRSEPSLPARPWPSQASVTPLYSVTAVTSRGKFGATPDRYARIRTRSGATASR
jgi:peroxiredoxin